MQAESRALGERERKARRRARRRRRRPCASLLLGLPNLVHPDAPDGASDADNPVVRGPINLPAEFAEHQRVPHWEAATALGILDNERAIKISGSMFAMTRGLGATLGRALCQLALDRNADAFEEVRPPSLVTTATLTASGQLPKFADDAFAVERDDLWCIPTAEVPLTSLYGDEILAEADLPVRMMAATPCYRREAGSAGPRHAGPAAVARVRQGRDPRRRHARAGAGAARRDGRARRGDDRRPRAAVADDRDLHRRPRPEPPPQLRHRGLRPRRRHMAGGVVGQLVLRLPGPAGEHPLPRSGRRRPKGTEIAHTLNGSALAVPRVWAAIVENFRQPDGSVLIPEVLHPYMRGATVDRLMGRDVGGELFARRVQYETAGLDVADVAADPIEQWRRWYDDASVGRGHRAERDGRSPPPTRRRPARRPLRARPRRRRAGLRVPHQLRQPEEPPGRRQPARRRRVRLARPAPPGPRARADGTGQRRRERRLLRVATARQPDRRVGVAAERGARRPRRPRSPHRRDRAPSSPAATSTGPSSGAAGASASTRSSSGRAARAASTTACATAATRRVPGSSSASRPEPEV